MTRHVQQTRARGSASGKHRADPKPRYGRIAALGSSLAVVVVAVLGSNGALPSSAKDQPDHGSASSGDVGGDGGSSGQGSEQNVGQDAGENAGPDSGEAAGSGKKSSEGTDPSSGGSAGAGDEPGDTQKAGDGAQETDDATVTDQADITLPSDSGTGKRVVFSESRQRVWLVNDDETVERTYLVSGSAYDNLDPGTFQVYSRDEEAVGIDDSGTMRLFVRFTQGPSGAAIGFHDIPVDNGSPVQTVDQLGLPLSHGCIRQKAEDAQALWDFAPIGTTVVVTP